MHLFVIILVEEDEEGTLLKSLTERYGENHLKLTDTTWLVAGSSSPGDLSDELGFSNEGGVTGMVTRISNYTGYADADLWDWMKTKGEEQSDG